MNKLSRKNFLKLAGTAGAALTLGTACEKTVEKIVPLVNAPKYPKPGEWISYATSCHECPAGCGMHLLHRDGRVTKAEGNPDHPVNKGGLCARGQSSLQGLYDPDRIKNVFYRKEGSKVKSDWEEAVTQIGSLLKNKNGKVVFISDLQTSSLKDLMNSFISAFDSDRFIFYEALNYESLKKAHQKVYGSPIVPRYKFDEVDFILSFETDFLETWISPVEFARQFNKMHSYKNGRKGAFTYVGSRLSMTAGNADKFIKVKPEEEKIIALALLKELNGSAITSLSRNYSNEHSSVVEKYRKEIDDILREFSNSNSAVVLGGSNGFHPDDDITALAAAQINKSINSSGVDFSQAHALSHTASKEEVEKLLKSINEEDVVFVHNTNPVFSRSDAKKYLSNAGKIIYLGTMENETAEIADWILPINYSLEEWGDYEPYAGTLNLMQPTMLPLYETYSTGQILLGIAEAAEKQLENDTGKIDMIYDEWIKDRWKKITENNLDEALRKGIIEYEAAPGERLSEIEQIDFSLEPSSKMEEGELSLVVYPTILWFDGRFANRGWLQEAPDPITTIVWRNWADIHPETAELLDIDENDIIEIESESGTIKVPVRISRDVAEDTVALPLGQGHEALGKNAENRGSNPFRLISQPVSKVKIKNTGEEYDLINLSESQEQYEREILRWTELTELKKMKPGEGEDLILPLPEGFDPKRDLFAPHEHKNHRWAMAIDLESCIGCQACSIACYAENNIPVMGEENCREGREMAWLKVTPYRHPESEERVAWLPLPCQHCDVAPCESVCPVFAAVHNEEGLNAQIYNRCIGTRYCSNNCPYKVRRFNWYVPEFREPLNMQLNPEVTVRTRGVMEKCTFCVQRIRNTEYKAKVNDREIEDGDIVPACAQSCPTQAIVFGDLLDKNSRVNNITRNHNRRYHLLEELNTKPAVTYLKRIENDKT